ncbi:poly(ADP-ribose) glycohydrolase [Pacmanvirus S19]|nr:poly(ADP-ribose) glycohydrolase [Pacmanvirus S19]
MSKKEQQRIIFPWETRKWPEIKAKLAEKIVSIIDMDSKISIMYPRKLRPRQIYELFNKYYSDEQYAKDRISQEFLIEKIIPHMQKLIETAPKTFRGFNSRLLIPNIKTNIVLTRPQVATLIACMWFGLFEYDYVSKGRYKLDDFPEPTFINIFSCDNVFTLQCVINYFTRVYQYMNDDDIDNRNLFAAGNIIISRNVLVEKPNWDNNDTLISDIYIGDGPTIDDSPAKMHVAFAHEFIGGDMFKGSLTQEEITLLIRPECIATTLFCAKLNQNETITVLGAEKMSQYIGYGSSARFVSNFIDLAPKGFSADETEVMLQQAVIFMDASIRTSGLAQFIDDFERDLNKAYCGFSSLRFSNPNEQVASGNWSYGFNGHNMQIKFIQQILAASAANKCLIYHPFVRDFEERVIPFIDWINRNQFTIGELFTMYKELIKISYSGPNTRLGDLDIFESLYDM